MISLDTIFVTLLFNNVLIAFLQLEEIYKHIVDNLPFQAIAFRSQHAITIVSQYPYRHIQIVLRLYKVPRPLCRIYRGLSQTLSPTIGILCGSGVHS